MYEGYLIKIQHNRQYNESEMKYIGMQSYSPERKKKHKQLV